MEARGIANLNKAMVLSISLLLVVTASAQQGKDLDDESIPAIDHYVVQRSMVPSIAGQFTELYVRERAQPATIDGSNSLEGRVVLFVHGCCYASEVAFDLPYKNYSWMAFLAAEGYDTFAVDVTGYGRSTRPYAMNDPCNLSVEDRQELGMKLQPCEPSYRFRITTIASHWADIDRAVDYIRELRQVSKVSLIAWSSGGPRAGGYAAQHPDKIDRLVLLAPAYTRSLPSDRPSEPIEGPAMRAQVDARDSENWDSQVGCPDQYDPALKQIIRSEALRSDPVGATWGSGTMRSPNTIRWEWNKQMINHSETPTLVIVGEHDEDRFVERGKDLYEDIGAQEKVLIDLACASHMAQFESNRLLLFDASLQWLRDGTVNDKKRGMFRMGD